MSKPRPPNYALVQQSVDRLKVQLGLTDWDVTVEPKDVRRNHRGAFAATFIYENASVAKMRVGKPYWAQDAAGRKQTLIHELVHLHTERTMVLTEEMAARLGPESAGLLMQQLRRLNEIAVDDLARVLARYLPD